MSTFQLRLNKRTLAAEVFDEHGSVVCAVQLYATKKKVLKALSIGPEVENIIAAIDRLKLKSGHQRTTRRYFQVANGGVPTVVVERRSAGGDQWFVCSWLGDANQRFKSLEISKGKLLKIAEREKSKWAVSCVSDDFRVTERSS